MYMSEKEKEVQKRYQQEQTRYKNQVEKINKIQNKKVAWGTVYPTHKLKELAKSQFSCF